MQTKGGKQENKHNKSKAQLKKEEEELARKLAK